MTILEKLHSSDVEFCDNRDRSPYSGLLAQFEANMSDHVMRIVRDDGVYRHLAFRRPDTGMYWFDLITWPGYLAITSDMGDYMFARITDMFEFFEGYINTDYWAEKLKASASGGRFEVKNHDEDVFRSWVFEDFWETSRDLSHEDTTFWWRSLKDLVFDGSSTDLTDANDCVDSLMNYVDAPYDHYSDVYEVNWDRYDWHFEFCLASIVTGIRTYKKHKEE